MVSTPARRAASLAVLVAALGYFVDIYDLILFGMIRPASLKDLGVTDIKTEGAFLLGAQMIGMLVGGIFWGVLGDKRGRLSVLFGSITLYSLANIANGMVDTVDQYTVCRVIAGFGLAGELGAGVTLVSELMGAERRGIGTTLVAGIGVAGGLLAGVIGGAFDFIPHPTWRVAYFIGGGLGLVLLALRIGVVESGMFHTAVAKANAVRGNFFALFSNKKRLVRYAAIIGVGIPIWYMIGIPFTFANDMGKAFGMDPIPKPATALFFTYGGASLGGFACGLISHYLRSRKRAIAMFLAGVAVSMLLYFTVARASLVVFYTVCAIGGFTTGYWAVFVAMAAEMFGTNLRATVTTTVPNFVRGALTPLLWAFTALGGDVQAAVLIGVAVLVVGAASLFALDETFAVDLDYLEDT